MEKYAPYMMKDGLVSKLSVYDDYELNELIMVSWIQMSLQ